MNNFTLDDIENLIISSKSRLDNTGEYDISYYENYINENIIIIWELIRDIDEQINLIRDENIKKRVLIWTKELVKAYEKNKNKQPRIEFENSPYSKSPGNGYLKSHKYSEFIGKDFMRLVRSYSGIINFMNNVYKNATILEKKNDINCNTLYDIFSITKKTCARLGIHCPDAQTICDSITDDLYKEKSNELLDMDFEIEEDNSLEEDILITSMPYTVTIPLFTWEGHGKIEYPVTDPAPKVWYNQSFFEKQPVK